jgi:predicted NBD/HSP70 family sugar kinase
MVRGRCKRCVGQHARDGARREASLATQAIVRQINEIKTLRALFEGGPLTRAEIARRLGVTKSTTSNVVAGLVAGGLVRDFEMPMPEVRGRPGTKVGLNAEGAYFIGAEIGVDRINVVLLDLAARVVGRKLAEADCTVLAVDPVLDLIQTMANALWEEHGVPSNLARGLCVALPGFMTREGVLLGTPRLGWRGFSLAAKLAERFSCPIAVENDANAFAFAEWYLTPALRERDLILVLLETGVGGGHISGGHLVRGAHGTAGEIGHMPLAGQAPDRLRATPSSWEDIVGKASLLAAAKQCGAGYDSTTDLCAAMQRGEPEAVDLVQLWARWLARGLAALAHIHDPDEIIIGGELTMLFEGASEVVEQELRRGLLAHFPVPRLSASRFQSHGCAIGAAAIMHASLFSAVSAEPVKL